MPRRLHIPLTNSIEWGAKTIPELAISPVPGTAHRSAYSIASRPVERMAVAKETDSNPGNQGQSIASHLRGRFAMECR